MKLHALFLLIAGMMLWSISAAYCQTFGSSGNTNLNVTVAAEASLYVSTENTALTSTGTLFSDYTGTTNFVYKIRTTKSSGTGNIQLRVTTDFSPAGGPSVANPPTPGDTLSYSCTVSSPATACSPGQVASTTSSTPVASFGANARSDRAGNSGSVAWTLTNDPLYETGTYSAVVTFTVSAT